MIRLSIPKLSKGDIARTGIVLLLCASILGPMWLPVVLWVLIVSFYWLAHSPTVRAFVEGLSGATGYDSSSDGA